jgi:hypothetical protein
MEVTFTGRIESMEIAGFATAFGILSLTECR